MKVTSIIKLIILFALFYYVITFIQVNQQDNTVKFPWIGDPVSLDGPAWAVLGGALAIGFLASALWLLVKTVIAFFSPTGRLSRSMKKVEEKYYYGIEALSKGDQEAAGIFFEEILAIDPDNFRTLIKYGELLRREGKSQRAISLHNQALSLSQNNVKVLHELSLDYMKSGDIDRAKEMLRKINEISPKGNIAIHRQLRDLLVDEKSWDEALKVQKNILDQVSDTNEKKDETDMLCGIEYENAMMMKNKESYQSAIELLKGIINRDKNFLPAHLELGECYLILNEDEKAVANWMKGYEITSSPVLLSRIENYYIGIDKPDKAIETYNEVIRENQENVLSKLLLGKLFYRLEMLDRAIEIFEEIDSEFEYAPVMFYFMGKIQARKGNFKESSEIFKNILRTSGMLEAEYKCSETGDTFETYVSYSPGCKKWNTVTLNVKKGKSLSELQVAARPIYA